MVSKEIKEAIMSNIFRALDDREYSYTRSVVDSIADKAFEQKKDLIELFSKHPNWNPEKLLIQFDTDYSREINTSAVHDFVWFLQRNLYGYDNVPEDHQKIFTFIRSIENQFFSPDMDEQIEEINKLNDNFKLRNNMKSSKAIGKICREMGWDKLDNYNTRYANLADCLNPIKTTRHTVISVNPVDFLLMSNGTSWESCHYIGNYSSGAGCYSSGTISYMLDNHSFVFYTVDAEYDGEDIELEPKVQREIFGYNDEVIFQSRLYPQSCDYGAKEVYTSIRNIVQKVIADCLEKPNLWNKTTSDIRDVVQHGALATCYPDWHYSSTSKLCSISTLQDRTSTLQRRIVMGAQPICIECGNKHTYQENINCCTSGYTCDDCGCYIREGEEYYCEGSEGTYCSDCVRYCEDCCQYEHRDDVQYVNSVDKNVCRWCLENNYSKCPECGEWVPNEILVTTEDGIYEFCESCAEELMFICDDCGGRFHKEEQNYDADTSCDYCNDCYDALLEERASKEEQEEENNEVA